MQNRIIILLSIFILAGCQTVKKAPAPPPLEVPPPVAGTELDQNNMENVNGSVNHSKPTRWGALLTPIIRMSWTRRIRFIAAKPGRSGI